MVMKTKRYAELVKEIAAMADNANSHDEYKLANSLYRELLTRYLIDDETVTPYTPKQPGTTRTRWERC
jgi:sugar diacid utilization regulator